MTDGPFRNTDLRGYWKRYGRDLESDAVSDEERVARVCDNLLKDVLKQFKPLWDDLSAFAQRAQGELDPLSVMEQIFEAHPKSPPFTDVLQKHIRANCLSGLQPEEAINEGLNAAVGEWRGIVKNRFDEHCVEARDRGDMTLQNYRKGIIRNGETFDAIDRQALCDALRAGDKKAFKPLLQKKDGINQGLDD